MGWVSFALCPIITACPPESSWSCQRCVLREHTPPAVTPATAAADRGNPPSPVAVQTWSDHCKPETKGCTSDQGLKIKDRDMGKACQTKCHVDRPQQPQLRTPSSAVPMEASFSGWPRAASPFRRCYESFKYPMCFTQTQSLLYLLPSLGRGAES